MNWQDDLKKMRRTVVKKCHGCDRIEDEEFCCVYVLPEAKWRLGICPMATHVKAEVKQDAIKVRIGQQKQAKKKKAKS